MLVMLSKPIAKLNCAQLIPYNEDDVMFVATPQLFFVLKNISNQYGDKFSIKQIMEDKKEIFACTDFAATCKNFAEIMDARLERFFLTKKADYLFFDAEEQKEIKRVLVANSLSCHVEIYIRVNGKMNKISLEELTVAKYDRISKYLTKLGVVFILPPDRFVSLNNRADKILSGKRKEDFKKYREKYKNKNVSTFNIDKVLEKYPFLDTTSKKGFDKSAKRLIKELHPDNNLGEDTAAAFDDALKDVEAIKSSIWYHQLKGD